jgi:hypothetical protein
VSRVGIAVRGARVRHPTTSAADVALDAATGLAVLGAAVFIALFAYVVLRRIGHPYELEWIEGGSLNQVARVVHGQSLYTAPTVSWTPNIYPPLYYWVGALVTRAVGLSLPALRAVSVAASIGLAVSVWVLVRHETREHVGPVVAIGLLFATYRIGGTWFDIARVDMLFLGLLFAALAVVRTRPTTAGAVTGAVLMLLALLAKQSALLPALAVLPWLWRRDRRQGIAYLSTFAIGSLGAIAVLEGATHGWFMYYMWTVPSGHAIAHSAVIGFWTGDVLRNLWACIPLVGVGLVGVAHRERDALWFHGPVFAALLLAAYTARLHTGGWDNVLLPAYAGIAVLAGIGVGWARSALPAAPAAAAIALVVVQFAVLLYNPAAFIPRPSDAAVADRFVHTVRGLPRPILLTGQPWLLRRADDAVDVTAASSALQDVMRAHAGTAARRLVSEYERDVRAHRWCSVVVDRPAVFSSLPADFAEYYVRARRVAPPEPVTGYAIRPSEIWLPRAGPACGRHDAPR